MAQPIRRGSRFPVSLFEPPALWDPLSEFEYLRDRMGRLYDQITPQGPDESPWQPDIEVDEAEEFYLVKAELPGITRDNVELQVDEHSLSITGSVSDEQGEHTMHRRAGRFFYRTVLPRDINTDKVQATMKEGILTIRLPKTKQATRRVQIRGWPLGPSRPGARAQAPAPRPFPLRHLRAARVPRLERAGPLLPR